MRSVSNAPALSPEDPEDPEDLVALGALVDAGSPRSMPRRMLCCMLCRDDLAVRTERTVGAAGRT